MKAASSAATGWASSSRKTATRYARIKLREWKKAAGDPAGASTQIARAAMQGAESETAHRNEQRRFDFDIQA
jgi:hypothetical protein